MPIFAQSKDGTHFLEKCEREYKSNNPAEITLQALQYVYYSLLKDNHDDPSKRLQDIYKTVVTHEAQHLERNKKPQHMPLDGTEERFRYEVHDEAISRTSEFRASLVSRLIDSLAILTSIAPPRGADKDTIKEFKIQLASEYLLLLALVKLIKQNPSEFGMEIKRDCKYDESIQIICQLHKLDKLSTPTHIISQRIIDAISHYLENSETLFSLLDRNDPYYLRVIAPIPIN